MSEIQRRDFLTGAAAAASTAAFLGAAAQAEAAPQESGRQPA
jgi:hypothetical protein